MLKPALLSNVFMSYLHYGNTSGSMSTENIDSKFFNMNCPFGMQFMCNLNGKHFTLEELFKQKETGDLGLCHLYTIVHYLENTLTKNLLLITVYLQVIILCLIYLVKKYFQTLN